MTVSTSYALDYQRDQLISAAYAYAGMSDANLGASDIALAAQFMNLELMSVQAEGIVLRTSEIRIYPLISGTGTYVLDADVIDVDLGPNDQCGTIINTSGTEILVTSMTQAEYMDLTDKTAAVTATPTRVYIQKQAQVSAVFWPVPDDNSVSWRVPIVRLLKDMDSGSVTMDLARRWLKAITFCVAHQLALAKNFPLNRVQYLRDEGERLKSICRNDDVERGKVRFSVGHKGAMWRGGR